MIIVGDDGYWALVDFVDRFLRVLVYKSFTKIIVGGSNVEQTRESWPGRHS